MAVVQPRQVLLRGRHHELYVQPRRREPRHGGLRGRVLAEPADVEGQRVYLKEFAMAHQAAHKEQFPLLMHCMRKGALTLEDVARQRQPYAGFAAQLLGPVKT